jgi:FkbM family methyltransferase
MNGLCADYYIEHKEEFLYEKGHEKLLEGLKKYIGRLDVENSQIIMGIDVGSCVGNYIYHLKDICPEENARFLCVEPNPVNLDTLEEKIKGYSSVQLAKCCISNVSGKAELFNWKGLDTNTTGNEIAGLRSGGEKICDVEVKRLDQILDEHYKDKDVVIKFIKIDTEGNDTNVIKSMGKYLSKTKYIIFECSDCLDDNRGPGIQNPMKDIVDYLSQHGFDTYRIGTKKLLKVNDEYWHDIYESVKFQSNCFAIQKDDPLIYDLIAELFNYTY